MKIASRPTKSTRLSRAAKSLSTLALAVMGVLGVAVLPSAAPILRDALASFAVLGAADGVTNVPTSTIGGNLGSAPSAAVGGGYIFTAGSLQPNTALAQQAQLDLDAAIVAVSAFGPGTTVTGGNLDAFQFTQTGFVISPGTYTVPALITPNLFGALILDGGGANDAVWVFQMESTLITGTASTVTVQNVGNGANVGIYWNVRSAAILDGPTFAGNVLAHDLISSDGNLTITCGRLLSATTQVTLINDTISIGCGVAGDTGFGSGGFDQGVDVGTGGEGGSGGQVVPEPGSLALLGLGLAALGLAGWRRRSRR